MRFALLVLALLFLAPATRAADPNYAAESAASVDATKAAAEAAAKTLAEHKLPPGYGAETPSPPENPKPALANIPAPPHAASPDTEPSVDVIPAQHFTARDEADIQRIQLYLNALKSISANFLQIDDHGGTMRGVIDIERPGKMRVTYDPPSKDFIVADGDFVHIWNAELQSQTNVPERSSLADFILRDPIDLGGDVAATSLRRFPAKLELTLKETKDPGEGSLTLIFEDHPLILRQWRVVDAEGRTTGVNLDNEQQGVQFSDSTFSFVPPNFGRGLHTETVP